MSVKMINPQDRLSGLLAKAKMLDMKRHSLKSASTHEEKERLTREIKELQMELES
jgi:hypothetical protein